MTVNKATKQLLSVSDTPVVGAFPKLRRNELVSDRDLPGLELLVCHNEDGPVTTGDSQQQACLDKHHSQLDPRFNRVVQEQFIRVAALRRDVDFRMCGLKGTAIFTGKGLLPAATASGLKPIRRRLWLLLLTWVCGILASAHLQAVLLPQGEYFDRHRSSLAGLLLVALAAGLWTIAGVLRAWRSGWAFGRISLDERVAAGVTIASLISGYILGVAAQPTKEQVDIALAKGDVAEAALIVDALKETQEASDEVAALRDEVLLASAKDTSGEARLRYLDAVAGGGRSRASEASRLAFATRIEELQASLQAADPAKTRRDLERWFKEDNTPTIRHLRGELEDLAVRACSDDVCKLGAAIRAQAAEGSEARKQVLSEIRTRLSLDLKFEPTPNEPVLTWLIRRREQIVKAEAIAQVPDIDEGLQSQAAEAYREAKAARGSVPLVGQTQDVIQELVGQLQLFGPNVLFADLLNARLFFSFDQAGVARGAYAARLNPENSQKLVNLITGREIVLRLPEGPPGSVSRTVTKWWEAGIPIVIRWKSGEPVEIRIGSAQP